MKHEDKINTLIEIDYYSNIIIESLINEEDKKFISEVYNRYNINKSDIVSIMNIYENEIKRLAKKIDTNWGISICMSIVSKTSYGGDKLAGYKLQMFAAWAIEYIYLSKPYNCESKKTVENLTSLIANIRVFRKLESIYSIYDNLPDKRINFINSEILFSHDDLNYVKKYMEAISDRGTRQRTAKDNTYFFLKNNKEFIEAIQEVLNGADPKRIKLFNNRVHKFLPLANEDHESMELWNDLYVGANLFKDCIEFTTIYSLLCKLTNLGIVFLDNYSIEDKTWNIEWCKEAKSKDKILLYERPVIKLNGFNMYITSYQILGDSINSTLENVFYNYRRDIQASEKQWKIDFKYNISLDFEKKVNRYLINKNFISGEVTSKGAWKNNKKVQLINMSGDNSKFPGQIDVLAKSDEFEILFVIECKVYKDLIHGQRINRINDLFLVEDKNNILIPLNNKAEYIMKSNILQEAETKLDVITILLTDIPFPIYPDFNQFHDNRKNILVLGFEQFKRYLDDITNNGRLNKDN
ncbi:hypothetical protein [Anaeromicropila herbilytica]|uniref:Uncharacterized protein n=1 Tax=Anaeromicropila herbilytica TaxID=2785025 RepID=A0A7R7ENS8_9FIRM|nr:hypothetical protein [Anaeromicropila herbilytica]BCN32011.1 hypothetical protein bsdtb5_33060 [Anaeromicropila herbilytica]